MDNKREIPSASYTFNGNVGTLIHHVDTLNMSVDKDMNVQIQNLDQLQAEQPTQTTTAELDPTPLIFLPNEQNKEAIIALLKSILSVSPKKSIVCKKLFEQRALFNLDNFDDTTKANIINAWTKEFQLQQNFKSAFTNQDFYANYSK
ncbi:MAG: hypothetical protein IJV81_03465 [Paludibacteraceae bacterium]|nr:hypothetical protein [Paludibacteraceae bacterium]